MSYSKIGLITCSGNLLAKNTTKQFVSHNLNETQGVEQIRGNLTMGNARLELEKGKNVTYWYNLRKYTDNQKHEPSDVTIRSSASCKMLKFNANIDDSHSVLDDISL